MTLGRGERAAAQPVTVHLQPPGAGDIGIELACATRVRHWIMCQPIGAAIGLTVRRGAETRALRVIVGHSLAPP